LTGYPQPREAETEASGRLPALPCSASRRSRTVDAVRITQVTAPSLVHIRKTTIGTAADNSN